MRPVPAASRGERPGGAGDARGLWGLRGGSPVLPRSSVTREMLHRSWDASPLTRDSVPREMLRHVRDSVNREVFHLW